jgi:transmembrane sensor
MDKFWEIAGKYNKTHQPDVDAAWRKFEDRIKSEEKGRVVPMWRRPVSWAAVALAVIAFAFLLQNNFVQTEISTFATSESETLQIDLPDGSTVELNENSTLSYETGFGKSNRNLNLQGEAFFDVTRNEAVPFVISTNHVQVEVLGTSFNVRDYETEEQAEVEVRSGLVKVAPPGQSEGITLSKGDLAYYNFSQNTIEKLEGQGYNAGGWIEKDLLFTDAPVAEIFSDIERLYDIQLITENAPILECSFDTEFKGEDLENIFEIFSIAFKCEFKHIDTKSFEVVGGRCK